jgi:hypothetical protein
MHSCVKKIQKFAWVMYYGHSNKLMTIRKKNYFISCVDELKEHS